MVDFLPSKQNVWVQIPLFAFLNNALNGCLVIKCILVVLCKNKG